MKWTLPLTLSFSGAIASAESFLCWAIDAAHVTLYLSDPFYFDAGLAETALNAYAASVPRSATARCRVMPEGIEQARERIWTQFAEMEFRIVPSN